MTSQPDRCPSRYQTQPPAPILEVDCDFALGHDGDHHGFGHQGLDKYEAFWPDEEALAQHPVPN